LNEIVQQCVRIEQGIARIATTREDYLNTSYTRRDFKREDHPSKSRYERSHEEERERKIEKSLFVVEPNIDNISPSINKPCEDVLEEKIVSGVEPNININCSSTENTDECLIQKEEEEETHKEEESLMTPLASLVEKESLKGDCNTLNSYFQLYNAHSSSQKSKKQYFVMLFPSLGNKQHKVNKNIFENGPMFC